MAATQTRDAIADALEVVNAEHFYKPSHGHVFEAICGLYASGEPADPVPVAEALSRSGLLDQIGGPGRLLELQASAPAPSSAPRTARSNRACHLLSTTAASCRTPSSTPAPAPATCAAAATTAAACGRKNPSLHANPVTENDQLEGQFQVTVVRGL